MARVVRKVSGKAVRGQKKGLLYSSKFWVSTVCATLAVIAIVLGLVFGLRGNSNDALPEVEDYFNQLEPFKTGDEEKDKNVKGFTKASYGEVVMRTNPNLPDELRDELYVDFAFVFATDLSVFYPKTLMHGEDDLKVVAHEEIFNALVLLQKEINKYNEKGLETKAALFIVDTKENSGSFNNKIFTNEKFGGTATGEIDMLLSLVNGDERITEFKDLGVTKKLDCVAAKGEGLKANTVQSFVNNARKFIDNGFDDIK